MQKADLCSKRISHLLAFIPTISLGADPVARQTDPSSPFSFSALRVYERLVIRGTVNTASFLPSFEVDGGRAVDEDADPGPPSDSAAACDAAESAAADSMVWGRPPDGGRDLDLSTRDTVELVVIVEGRLVGREGRRSALKGCRGDHG